MILGVDVEGVLQSETICMQNHVSFFIFPTQLFHILRATAENNTKIKIK